MSIDDEFMHNLFLNGVILAIISMILLFCAGFLPSIVKKTPFSRIWVATVAPGCFAFFMIMTDGVFLKDPGIEITKMIVIWAMAMGILWGVTSVAEKAIDKFLIKKGDLEIEISTGKKENKDDRRHKD